MEKKKILIVSVYFPPFNSIASFRAYSWAKTWTDIGYEVTVLTIAYPNTKDDLNYNLEKINVIRLKDPIPGRTVYYNDARGKSNVSFITHIFASIVSKFRKLYLDKLFTTGILIGDNFPSFFDLWALKAIKFIKNCNYDLVVSTGGPYSVHRVGLYLKKHHKTNKWVCDWRDLWTQSQFSTGMKCFRNFEKKLEKKFHDNADLITCVSEGQKENLDIITNTPIKVIYNGFIADDFVKIKENPRNLGNSFTLSYLGKIYKGCQDPEPLFQAVKELYSENKINSSSFKMIFAGGSDYEYIQELVKKYEIEDFYKYLGVIPHEQALQIEYDSDIVLFLDYYKPNVKGILTGKLFEILYIAKDILCIGSPVKSEAGMIIERLKCGKCLYKDVDSIKSYLLSSINSRKEKNDKDVSGIAFFDRSFQAKKLLELVLSE